MGTYMTFGIFILMYILIFCAFDLLHKKRIEFGFNLFSSLWVSFAYSLYLKGLIVSGVILWVVSMVLSGPLYRTFFIRPIKPVNKPDDRDERG